METCATLVRPLPLSGRGAGNEAQHEEAGIMSSSPHFSASITSLLEATSKESLLNHWGTSTPSEAHNLDHPLRDQLVGVRLGSLVAKLRVEGDGLTNFPYWVHWLDSHFPSELGQLNHSKTFAEKYADNLFQSAFHRQVENLHQCLPALKIPSDYARILDGITCTIGESFLIHVVVFLDWSTTVSLKWMLLDLTSQGKTSEAIPLGERRRRGMGKTVLGFHGLVRTVDKCHETERNYGLELSDRFLRFAVNVGDGAMEGPFGVGVGDESARRTCLPASRGWGSLDGLHACDKAGARADALERRPGGYIHRFHRALELTRSNFKFGNGRVVARSISRKYKVPWRSPASPHSQGTRMVVYESSRCPANLFANLRCIVLSCRLREKEAVENARRRYLREGKNIKAAAGWKCKDAKAQRFLGRTVLDPGMLLFICGRFEHRRSCLLKYTPAAQSLIISGLEKQLLQEGAEMDMRVRVGASGAMLNVLYMYEMLQNVLIYTHAKAFFGVMFQSVAGKVWPMLTNYVMEVIFDRSFQGLPLGMKADGHHPFCEPGKIDTSRQALERTILVAAARKEALRTVREALERLHRWYKSELLSFQQRVVYWESSFPVVTAEEQAPNTECGGADCGVDDCDSSDPECTVVENRRAELQLPLLSDTSSPSSSSSSSTDSASENSDCDGEPPVLPWRCEARLRSQELWSLCGTDFITQAKGGGEDEAQNLFQLFFG